MFIKFNFCYLNTTVLCLLIKMYFLSTVTFMTVFMKTPTLFLTRKTMFILFLFLPTEKSTISVFRTAVWATTARFMTTRLFSRQESLSQANILRATWQDLSIRLNKMAKAATFYGCCFFVPCRCLSVRIFLLIWELFSTNSEMTSL